MLFVNGPGQQGSRPVGCLRTTRQLISAVPFYCGGCFFLDQSIGFETAKGDAAVRGVMCPLFHCR